MALKRKLYFRADVGPNIGYGHFIRCLALANMLKQDFDCTMYTQMPSEYQLKEASGVCPVVALPSNNTKFDIFLNHLQGDEIVVLDNYFFTTEYQRAIKDKGCKLVCIDDVHDKHYVADIVINHGVNDATLFDIEPSTKLCLGHEYALLRQPFLEVHDEIHRVKGMVVVCFGGSDPHNLTCKYVELLMNSRWVKQIIAVVGDGYQYKDSLSNIPNVQVRSRLSADSIARLFRKAEAVVCSASTTAYEALACGAKVYAGWYVDNQIDFYHHLCACNAISPLGNLLKNDTLITAQTDTTAICLTNSKFNLRKLFWRLSLRQKNYTELSTAESKQVWQTRNLPEVRQWMFNSAPFSWEEHSHFVATLAQRSDIYIAFFDENQLVASYDMTHIQNNKAECGLYLHPDYKGKGIASMIEEIMETNAKKISIRTLSSQVLNHNADSLAFFTRNGFTIIDQDEEITYLEKQL